MLTDPNYWAWADEAIEEELMRFYHVSAAIDGAPYTATLEEAKRIARNAAANSYHDVVVEQIEVATDKENVLRLLNNAAGTHMTQGVAYTAKAKLKAGELI